MTYESRSCMFLLLSAVAGFLSVAGAEITVKYVCPGDSVQAFENIEFNHCNANVHLVINDDRNAEIAVWSIQNCIRYESILPEYEGRLIFDQNGTITIKNFDHLDQAHYFVISKMDPLQKIYEVQLSLMVAPTTACKPMIEQLGNSLIARLNANYCGKPVAVPYWKDSDSDLYTDQPILNLTTGMEARKYNACIKGAALTCVKNVTSHDYCTTFTTEGSKSPPARLETCNADALIAVCIIFGIFVMLTVLALVVIYNRYRPRTNPKKRHRYKELKQSDEMQDQLQIQEAQPSTVIESDDPPPMTEQASTMHQHSHNPYLMREIVLITGLCAFCKGEKIEKSTMFVLPCEHLGRSYKPTCIKCDKSARPCEQCMASKRKSMEFATWTVLPDSARN